MDLFSIYYSTFGRYKALFKKYRERINMYNVSTLEVLFLKKAL
jgi:hypothetical protein